VFFQKACKWFDTPVSASAEGLHRVLLARWILTQNNNEARILSFGFLISSSFNDIDQSTMTNLAVAQGIAAARFRAS
jgi:hypothetical protein